MTPANKNRILLLTVLVSCLLLTPHISLCDAIEIEEQESIEEQPTQDPEQSQETPPSILAQRRIREINVLGNTTVPSDALLNYVPYHSSPIPPFL